MSNASLLLSVLQATNEPFKSYVEIPRLRAGETAEHLALRVTYARGVADVLKELQEAAEKAQGHSLEVPSGEPKTSEEEPQRLSADQALLSDVQ